MSDGQGVVVTSVVISRVYCMTLCVYLYRSPRYMLCLYIVVCMLPPKIMEGESVVAHYAALESSDPAGAV